MSQAFLPSIRKKMLDDPYSPNEAYDDEFFAGNSTPSGTISQTAPAHPTLGGVSAPTPTPDITKDVYSPELREVGQKLNDAYSAPRPGMFRQIVGGLLSKKNPAIGGIVSGETQRQQTIQPLQQQYGLLADIISKNRAQQSQDITNRLHNAQADYFEQRPDLMNQPKQTPDELAFQDYVKQGLSPAAARAKMAQDLQDTKPDKNTPDLGTHTAVVGNRVKQYNPQTHAYDIDMGPSPKSEPVPDKPKKTLITVPNPDGSATLREVSPGQTIPKGATGVSDELKAGKPTSQEQNRADLAKNLNENLDTLEEIVNRRPELFGPVAGRFTEGKMLVGSNDPDVAALQNIKHQAGMAQISAHGMRSAQGIEGAAQALMNYHNEPDAIKGAIKSARNSVATFTQDAEAAKNKGATPTKPGGFARPKPNVVVEQ